MKTKMYQNNQENSNSFKRFANQALNLEEMGHLFGGESGSSTSGDIESDPPIYIKEE